MKIFPGRPDSINKMDERLGARLGHALGNLPIDGECPFPEELASLADKRLTMRELDGILAHLAGCERCRDVYVIACQLAHEEMPVQKTYQGWQVRRLIPLALAASLLLVIVSWPMLVHKGSDVKDTASSHIDGPTRVTRTENTAPVTPKPSGLAQKRRPVYNETRQLPPTTVKSDITEPGTKSVNAPTPAPAESATGAVAPLPSAPSGEAILSHNIRVKIDAGQRLRLRETDPVLFDKDKIAALFNDLKLDTREFPLQDVNKVIIKWWGNSKPDDQAARSRMWKVTTADISLGEGGVLTIVVRPHTPSIAVGC